MSGRTERGYVGQKIIRLCVADMLHPHHARFVYRLATVHSGKTGGRRLAHLVNYVRPCGRPAGTRAYWVAASALRYRCALPESE
jgi:hypothetical protein